MDEKNASTGFKAAILTIWNPSEDVSIILNKSCEGQCCTFHHLTANGFMLVLYLKLINIFQFNTNKVIITMFRNGELQISTNKNTRFDFQGFKNEFAKRDVVSFKNIWSGTFLPLFSEIDFVGIVVSNVNKSSNTCNEIYVSDKEMNIVSILFRGSIKVIFLK